jgi:hypothetical protein
MNPRTWWMAKYRDENGKLHMWPVEAETEEEARMCGEIETNSSLESIEPIDESKFVSPLLSQVRP